MKQLQECLRTGLYVWCGRWEKTSRSLNGFLWQTSEIFCTQNLLLLALCCRSTIKGKPLWRHRDQQPLFGEEMCPDLPSISHLFCPWDSHKGTLIQVATSSAPESFWVKSRSCVVKVDTFIMSGTFPLCLFFTECSVIREDLLPFSEVGKQTSIPLNECFFHSRITFPGVVGRPSSPQRGHGSLWVIKACGQCSLPMLVPLPPIRNLFFLSPWDNLLVSKAVPVPWVERWC